jgi:hypothetical protein
VKEFLSTSGRIDDKSLYTSLYVLLPTLSIQTGRYSQLYLQKTPEKNSYIIPEDISIQGHFRYLLPVLDIITAQRSSILIGVYQ